MGERQGRGNLCKEGSQPVTETKAEERITLARACGNLQCKATCHCGQLASQVLLDTKSITLDSKINHANAEVIN